MRGWLDKYLKSLTAESINYEQLNDTRKGRERNDRGLFSMFLYSVL